MSLRKKEKKKRKKRGGGGEKRKSRNTNAKAEDSSFKYRSGPIVIELDKALKRQDRCAVISREILHQYPLRQIFERLCVFRHLLYSYQKLVDDPEIHLEVHIIQQTFDELNGHFIAVHKQSSVDFPNLYALVSQNE